MILGDSLAQEALAAGSKTAATVDSRGTVHLAVTLPDGAIQHFERPSAGTCADWRATDLEALGSGFAFNESITEQWGHALTLVAHISLT
ncbi:hypothetical protein [Streptomyces alanosinicus]|uniref:Uncharacterized protein n=1 Tax=Streptomyces alanosinicus TaxID=68171 RepID=A0A919D5C1_9ACTN|nr:hypothetical protein [Streptomyces alanosinicus]GHE11449.1 hypothetical protein GCM10010339_71360 [Streptomyces alanosinicus]